MGKPQSQPTQTAPAGNRRLLLIFGSVAFLVACLVIRASSPTAPAHADTPPPNAKPKGAPPAAGAGKNAAQPGRALEIDQPKRDVIATVNNENIPRVELGKQCLKHYGKEVLERLVNKQLIVEACKQKNITITREEVEQEIDRMAQRFGVPTEQLLKLLEEERGIHARQYAEDIIWPTLALQKLAAPQLVVSEKELFEAHETQYGEAIRARMIACRTRDEAEALRAQTLKNPDAFGDLAMEKSCDASSAAAKGLIQPIRKHMGIVEIEQAAFALEDGAISAVIPVGNQFVFLKREGTFPARNVPMASVEKTLRDSIRDKKLRTAADDVFRQLQDQAKLDIVYNDPQRREQEPGIAARINGTTITLADLAEECISRHGREVLEGVISRRILEQECKRKKVAVVQADIDRELARAAEAMNKLDPQTKKPDVAGWLKSISEEQGIPADVYIQDAVWPSVALKRLVEKNVDVTQQDMDRGFEANYGPRVRCRAIVLNNLRRANEVWEMARRDPSVANFSRLAEQFSIEASSRALAGEVPPIQKWGGSPHLEKEAFALAPGELSGIIQVGEQYVMLLCEGHTTPVAAKLEDVKELLREDIFEKKLSLAMANEFDRLRDTAHIDNYLANTSHKPQSAERDNVSLDTRAVQPAGANQPRMGTKVTAQAAAPGQAKPTKAPVNLTPAPVNRPAAK